MKEPTTQEKLEKLRNIRVIDVYQVILSGISSEIYIDYLNAESSKDFVDIFFLLFSHGQIVGSNYTNDEVGEVSLAAIYRRVDDFKKSRIGKDFINAQAKLREDVVTGKIYNPSWQDVNFACFAIRLSTWNRTPTIAKTDPLSILRVRLIVDVINGERIAKCEREGCGKFFKAYRKASPQRFCSSACRSRAFRRREKERAKKNA